MVQFSTSIICLLTVLYFNKLHTAHFL